MLAEFTLNKVTFKDYTLKAELLMDSFNITNVVTSVKGIDAASIEFLITALNDLIIAENMAKKLKEGIYLNFIL